ncbi:MAG: beta-ketoacyl-ACP synthase II [Treponemataceae bacterium]|nr:MAG: beta-ketoacyl-ACP synthase II [Treponemataceae bacterium]
MRRVVITGMGAVTPVGNSVDETWASVQAGKSGIAKITRFDASNLATYIAGEVKNFEPDKYMDKKEARKMAYFARYAVYAAGAALEDAGIEKNSALTEKMALFIGNGIGGFEVFEESCVKCHATDGQRVPPLAIPMLIPNEAAGNVCMTYGIRGVAHTVVTACASGTDALGDALDLIRSGRTDICMAGGTESTITLFGVAAFNVLQALSTSFNEAPEKASRPFDKKRDGFVMGEGAGLLILEEYEHAKKRGAKIYCELAGYGGTSDAYHITSPRPDGSGGKDAMLLALKDAGIKPQDLQYYNAHGTSTQINDKSETQMLKDALGEHAKKIKISSTKSMTGHCLGAAGAVEAIITIKAMQDGFFPATINLDEPDIEAGCDLDYTPNKGVEGKIDCAASGSLGFGGHNGVIVLRKI